ncbi:MAG: hypothetical protein WKF96_22055 [Solirubrobacteraceae bacterium]
MTSRRAALARARREAASGAGDAKAGVVTGEEAARIHKWRSSVAEAERNVNLRRDQIEKATPRPSSRGLAVAWAAARVGTTERPAGSNRGPSIDVWQRAFGFLGVAWCGLFAGCALRAAGVKGITSRIASVALIEDDARAGRAPFSAWTSSGSGVLRGDLVVIGGSGTHVELVVERHGDGACTTLGGNTSSGPGGSQSNGGGVFRRVRSPREITGYARVNFS